MRKPDVLNSDWYDQKEVQTRLNLAERTLRTWVNKLRLIEVKIDPQNTRRKLYKAADVERLALNGPPVKPDKRQEPRKPTEAVARRGNQVEKKLQRALETVEIVGQMVAALRAETSAQMERWKGDRDDSRERFEAQQKQWDLEQERWKADVQAKYAPKPKLWLTVPEASELSGLPREFLAQLCVERKVDALNVGTGSKSFWRICLSSLEEFRG